MYPNWALKFKGKSNGTHAVPFIARSLCLSVTQKILLQWSSLSLACPWTLLSAHYSARHYRRANQRGSTGPLYSPLWRLPFLSFSSLVVGLLWLVWTLIWGDLPFDFFSFTAFDPHLVDLPLLCHHEIEEDWGFFKGSTSRIWGVGWLVSSAASSALVAMSYCGQRQSVG